MITQIERPDVIALAPPALVNRGCVHVIGFDALRERAGARWASIHASVHLRLETILRRQLGPSDFFIPLDEGAYLITMPGSESKDTEIACLRAAYELSVSYLGDCGLESIFLYRATRSDDTAIRIERVATERLRTIAEFAGISPQGRGSHKGSAAERDISNDRGPLNLELEFQPVWDTQHEAVMLNICRPRKITLRATPSVVLTVNDLTANHRAKIEISCLHQGVAALVKYLASDERFLMVFQIGYDTLNSHAARVEFTSACRELPSDLRQYLVFQLIDIPKGVPRSRLSDLVVGIKPFANGLMLEVPDFCIYDDYVGIGLQTIGMNLARSHMNGEQQAKDLLKLVMFANQLPLSTYLAGVSDAATLLRARQAKIRFMMGPAVAPSLPTPNPIRRLNWNQVMQSAAH